MRKAEGSGKIRFVGAIEGDGVVYYQIIAEILSGTQCTLITASFENVRDWGQMIELLKQITAKLG